MTTKTCTKCKKTLPHLAFGAQAASPDGFRSNCRTCRSKEGYIPKAPRPVRPPKRPAPTEFANTHEWTHAAACRDMDPRLFDKVTTTPPPKVRAACQRCPIREMCLEEELHPNGGAVAKQSGYRGGTTPAERARIIRERKAAAKAERNAAKSTAA